MASDNLNEVGKYIKQTRERADYASKKVRPNRPAVERTRDIFDSVVDFEMKFDVSPKQKRVGLDLEFNRPPPMQGCLGSPCRMACETFDSLAAGDHEIQLDDAYITGLASVYVNGASYSSAKWAEVSPDAGSILVTGLTQSTNTVTVCYMRECETTFDCGDISAHGGTTGQDLRYDVFGAHLLSGGACEWNVPPFLDGGATNFCYIAGGGGNGLTDSYGAGDPGVGGPGPIQPYGTPNNGGNWGMPATVWSGGHSEGTWTFGFPAARLCAAVMITFGGGMDNNTVITVDNQAGVWDAADGSFNSVGIVPLVPVVASEISLHWEYNAPPGLQFYGGVDFRYFMVYGELV